MGIFKKNVKKNVAEKDEIDEAIESIKAMDSKAKKHDLFSKLFSKREKPATAHPDEKKIKPDTHLKPESGNINTINNLIKSARSHLINFELEEAKHDYTEIIRIYNQLNNDEQKKIYEDIKDIYDERKNAEALNLKS